LPYPDKLKFARSAKTMSDLLECIEVPNSIGAELRLIDLRQPWGDPQTGSLAEWERERAARFRFEKDARRYLVSHAALRQLLGQHLGMPPAQVPLQTTPLGKPFIQGHPVHFNMSHSEDWGLIGLHHRQIIGVDIELHHTIHEIEALARQNYTAAEWAAVQTSLDPLDAFLTCWTRKEACLKALGSGFSIEPGRFETGVGKLNQTVLIKTPDKELCAMTVSSLDFSREREKHPHLPHLHGAIALVAPEDADRVC
jgi:4'-phosphopantetheinyl transferase